MSKYCICLAYNDLSNRNAHEKKKHGGVYNADAITTIKEDCETWWNLKQNEKLQRLISIEDVFNTNTMQ